MARTARTTQQDRWCWRASHPRPCAKPPARRSAPLGACRLGSSSAESRNLALEATRKQTKKRTELSTTTTKSDQKPIIVFCLACSVQNLKNRPALAKLLHVAQTEAALGLDVRLEGRVLRVPKSLCLDGRNRANGCDECRVRVVVVPLEDCCELGQLLFALADSGGFYRARNYQNKKKRKKKRQQSHLQVSIFNHNPHPKKRQVCWLAPI